MKYDGESGFLVSRRRHEKIQWICRRTARRPNMYHIFHEIAGIKLVAAMQVRWVMAIWCTCSQASLSSLFQPFFPRFWWMHSVFGWPWQLILIQHPQTQNWPNWRNYAHIQDGIFINICPLFICSPYIWLFLFEFDFGKPLNLMQSKINKHETSFRSRRQSSFAGENQKQFWCVHMKTYSTVPSFRIDFFRYFSTTHIAQLPAMCIW